jgi:hypothetical protein
MHGCSGIAMMNPRVLAIPLLCAVFVGPAPGAQDLSNYRGFELGMSAEAASKKEGIVRTEIRVVHQRPDTIQELEWEPLISPKAVGDTPDPVRNAVLSFYKGQLCRIVVIYDRSRVEGMSVDDMVDAVSSTYGPAVRPNVEIAFHSSYAETASVIARWSGPDSVYDLVRTGDQSSFALVVYSKRLDALAQASIIQAVKLEALDAPRLEMEREKKREDDNRLAAEKARSVNRPNFRP